MPTPEEVQAAVRDLEPGTEVHLELADGREITGKVSDTEGDRLVLDDVDPDSIADGEENGIALADVERVSESFTSEGPE